MKKKITYDILMITINNYDYVIILLAIVIILFTSIKISNKKNTKNANKLN